MSDPTLIVLPGLDGTGLLLQPLRQALPPSLTVQVARYAPDRVQSIAELADEVRAAILAPEDSVILAESFSSLVLFELLDRCQLRPRKVIFCAGFAEPPRPLLLALLPWAPLEAILRRSPPALAIKALCLGMDADAALVTSALQAIATVHPEVIAHRLRLVATTRRCARGRLETPCLTLRPQHDRLVPRRATARLGAHFLDVREAVTPGPHFLLQARPAEAARRILEFLGMAPDP